MSRYTPIAPIPSLPLPLVTAAPNTNPLFLVRVRVCDCQQGEIAEGSESEVRASNFVVAVRREESNGVFVWRAAEIAFSGDQLYL